MPNKSAAGLRGWCGGLKSRLTARLRSFLRALDKIMAPISFYERIERWLLVAPRQKSHAVAGLVLLSCLFFLPGFFTMSAMDRDEPRFAQATRQMVETHDYVSIRFMDEARNKKPVGIYWLQALSLSAAEYVGIADAEHQIWVYRLPSLLGAISAVLLTYWAALAFLSSEGAWCASLLCASCLLIGVESRLAKTDAVVCATVAACLGVMARLYMSRGHELALKWAAVFWGAIGIGVLVKGPITPLAPLCSALVLSWHDKSVRWLGALRPVRGLIFALALVLPWFVMIMALTHGAFLQDSLGEDMMSKVAAGQESHGAPFGTYLIVFLITGWPLAPLLFISVPKLWRHRQHKSVKFLAAWIIPVWLIFESVTTKLPHYVLPLFPALAIACVLAFEHENLSLTLWQKRIAYLICLVPVTLLVIGVGGSYYFHQWPDVVFIISGLLMIYTSVLFIAAVRSGAFNLILARALILALVSYPFAYSGVISSDLFAPFRLSPRMAQAAQDIAQQYPACPHFQIVSVGYSEPSLALLMDRDFAFMVGAQAASFMSSGECRMAFVSDQFLKDFLDHTQLARLVRSDRHVLGINLNSGRHVDLSIFINAKAAL
jgi:4-amino-4-deoxy-L-arabinose transferase-like glycosyltransferase